MNPGERDCAASEIERAKWVSEIARLRQSRDALREDNLRLRRAAEEAIGQKQAVRYQLDESKEETRRLRALVNKYAAAIRALPAAEP